MSGDSGGPCMVGRPAARLEREPPSSPAAVPGRRKAIVKTCRSPWKNNECTTDGAALLQPRCGRIEGDVVQGGSVVCRNIKTLFNFEPPSTDEEIRASSVQFVRKLSGFNKPSKANDDAFNLAVREVTDAARRLVHSLVTTAPPRNREAERAKAMAGAARQFGAR